jgi:uncharacterized protein YuzE
MTQPLELKIDYEANASYVRYRQLQPGEHVATTQDVLEDGSVIVDRDVEGNVLGIELLGFSPAVIAAGILFANKHNLDFPRALTDVPGGQTADASAVAENLRAKGFFQRTVVRLSAWNDALKIFNRKTGPKV